MIFVKAEEIKQIKKDICPRCGGDKIVEDKTAMDEEGNYLNCACPRCEGTGKVLK